MRSIGVLDLSPESLKLLDDYLTPELCSKTLQDRELFFPIVGEFESYFGEVLIKNLGGEVARPRTLLGLLNLCERLGPRGLLHGDEADN